MRARPLGTSCGTFHVHPRAQIDAAVGRVTHARLGGCASSSRVSTWTTRPAGHYNGVTLNNSMIVCAMQKVVEALLHGVDDGQKFVFRKELVIFEESHYEKQERAQK